MKRVQKKMLVLLSVLMFFSAVFVPVPAYAAGISLKPKKLTLYVGETKSLRISASLKGKVKWKSSDPKVASVSSKGKVKAKKAGNAVITVKIKSKKASCKVTVKNGTDLKSTAKKNAKTYRQQIEDIVKYTNQYRAKAGRAPLKLDTKLMFAACHRSAEMAKANQLSHTRPDGSTPYDLMTQYGIRYLYAGENIAYTGGMAVSAKKASEMWYNSPGHRENMLRKEYGKIGIGVAVTEYGEVYYTQLFTD